LPHVIAGLGLLVSLMLQLGVVSRVPLLSGTADLILLLLAAWGLQERVKNAWLCVKCLWIGLALWTIITGIIISIISAMPFYIPLIAYLAVTGISQLFQRRVWQTPILAMLLVTFVGTLFQQALYILSLQVIGTPISWSESLNLVTLPSLLLNLLLAIPIYAIVNDIAGRIYPSGIDNEY